MIDVGGQRSERRKWIHCFQDVTAVIFCVALSEFDMRLYEDDITNRMQESLKLWKETCGTKWFINTNLILFFTKDDIFREKMTTGASIRSCFTDYNGPDEYQASVDYIVQQFKAQNKNHNKTIDCHVLCATDTTVVDRLFNDIQEAIITNLVNTKTQSV